MKTGLVSLENAGYTKKQRIAIAQDRPRWNEKVFPRNESERGRSNGPDKLRDYDDVFAAVFVGQMSSRQGESNHGNYQYEANQP
jgi:hypothetical protein